MKNIKLLFLTCSAVFIQSIVYSVKDNPEILNETPISKNIISSCLHETILNEFYGY